MKKAAIVSLLCFSILLFAPLRIHPQDLYLIEAESPYVLPAWNLEIVALGGYDFGEIPTALLKPQIGVGLFGVLQLSAASVMVYFPDEKDFVFSGWEASLRARIPPLQSKAFSLFGYAKVHQTTADPYTVPYGGSLTNVYAVMSPYTDKGLDITGGVAGSSLFPLGPLDAGILFSADYSRTINRDYNPVFDDEGYKNRIFLNGAPAVFFNIGKTNPLRLTLLAQNRFTYWFERGHMYDLLPQANFMVNPHVTLIAGASLPMVGAGVYKAYVGAKVTLSLEGDERITVRDLYFPPDKAVLFGPQNERSRENARIIDRLYEQLKKYPGYSIIVEGHTSFVYWDDPEKGPAEQRDVLLPLSKARARAVMEALVSRGISPSRITAVGKGGVDPVVPFRKTAEQWKNRRVEIVLKKPRTGK